MSSHFSHRSRLSSGFGLIELMVSISIMMLVAAIILIRQDSFNGAVLLEGQAYEMALSLREVQQNAVSASALGGTTRGEMLGMYFDTTRRTTFRIYRDNEKNGSYDASEEYGQQNSLDSRFEIKAIRVGCSTQSSASVMFERPNFDAKFYVGTSRQMVGSVEIDIGAKDTSSAGVKTVIISAAGQISVSESECS